MYSNNIKKLISLCLAVVTVLAMSLCVFAEEGSVVTESADFGEKGTILVAGNPSCYPVEYYDTESKCYCGIMPEILNRISENTGYRFTYVGAGIADARMQKAKNNQVEVISCLNSHEKYGKGIESFTQREVTFEKDGLKSSYCFGFTGVASEELVSAFSEAFEGISDAEILGMSVDTAENKTVLSPTSIIFIVILALLVVAAVIAYHVNIRKRNITNTQKDERIDASTGIGNKFYLANAFEEMPMELRSIHVIAFFGFEYGAVAKSLGFEEAEQYIRNSAEKLKKICRDPDVLTRAGDGFAVLHMSENREDTTKWIKEILSELNTFDDSEEMTASKTFRAGIYEITPNDSTAGSIRIKAEQGFARAESQRLDYCFTDKTILNDASNRETTIHGVDRAVENGEFKMYLQLSVDAKTGKIAGADALTRWDHPEKGLLHPGQFIKHLEDDELIKRLDYYIFDKACAQLESWQKKGFDQYISCIFNHVTLVDPSFDEKILEIAGKYDFKHESLVIEISDTVSQAGNSHFADNIKKCKEAGMKVVFDNIGTGFTSFLDLRGYGADIAKIKSFVVRKATDEKGRALLKGLIDTVKSQDIMVICEGIETEDEFNMVKEMECDVAQGFYFYRPMPQEVVTEYLEEQSKAEK